MAALLLAHRRRPGSSWLGPWLWALAGVIVGSIMVVRFDVVPTLFAVVAILVVARPLRAGAAAALGFTVKVWPALMLFVVPRRQLPKALASFAVTVVLVLGAFALLTDGSLLVPRQPAGAGPAGRVGRRPALRGVHPPGRRGRVRPEVRLHPGADGRRRDRRARPDADRAGPLRADRVVAALGPPGGRPARRRRPRGHARLRGHQPRLLPPVQRVAHRHHRRHAPRPALPPAPGRGPRGRRLAADPGRLSVVGHPAGHRRSPHDRRAGASRLGRRRGDGAGAARPPTPSAIGAPMPSAWLASPTAAAEESDDAQLVRSRGVRLDRDRPPGDDRRAPGSSCRAAPASMPWAPPTPSTTSPTPTGST